MRRLAWVTALGVVAGSANATIWVYSGAMNGFQEVPQNTSPAIGTLTVQVNDVTNVVSGSGSIQFLFNAPTDSHIHEAAYGVSGPVRIPVGAGVFSGSTATGNWTFNFSVNLPANGVSTSQLLTFLNARNGYFNIHTAVFPGGELRGQLMPVPEPASLAALSLGAIALVRRRLRK